LNSNLGFSKANNRIIRSGTEEYVALLNADAVPDLNWIQKLIEAMDEFPDAGFAASKMLYFHKPDIIDRAGDGYTRAGVGLLRGRGQHISNYQRNGYLAPALEVRFTEDPCSTISDCLMRISFCFMKM
jgi:GT2 family glycosyltransferase